MTHADRYRADDPDRKFIQSREWRERIRPAQLRREPLCRFCMALGQVNTAEQVDHIKRPRGDRTLQRDPDNFQSLCAEHHGMKSSWERTNQRNGTNRPLVLGTTRDGWTRILAPGGVESLDPFAAQPTAPLFNHKL